jgi:Protein of Unknown function (DUF2784)
MPYRLFADLVVIVHLAFVCFVVLGGLLVLRRPRLAMFHLPVAFYGVLIEWVGWLCPLTPLENALRRAAGDGAYQGGFVEHYILPVLYPRDLTRPLQLLLGALVLVLNLAIYAWVIWRAAHRRHPTPHGVPHTHGAHGR